MSCYRPFLGIPSEERNENGNITYKITGRWSPDFKTLRPGSIPIPCGKCIGCRLDYSRSWADRMMLEYDHTKKAVFITLTYNNEHVPFTETEDGDFGTLTLFKRDLQLFFKRVRKKFEDREIRYYAVGEYGSTTERPHYHAIVFGIDTEDLNVKPLRKNELGQLWYRSEILDNLWSIYHKQKKDNETKEIIPAWYEPIGYTLAADVSWKTCAYVSRYVQKKIFAVQNLGVQFYGAEPEFSCMSRNPGIGSMFYEENPDELDHVNTYLSGVDQPIRIPRYNLKKLKDLDKEKYDAIIRDRKEIAEDATLLKLQQSELSYLEQLELEENQKLLKTNVLKRF